MVKKRTTRNKESKQDSDTKSEKPSDIEKIPDEDTDDNPEEESSQPNERHALLCSPFLNLRMLNQSPEIIYRMAQKVFDEAVEVFKEKYGDFIESMALATKISQGYLTGELSIRVLVKEKVRLSDLAPEERIPNHYKGLPTDIVVRHYRTLQGDGTNGAQGSELLGGMSIAPRLNPTAFGTMSVSVYSFQDGKIYYLTCAHVVADQVSPIEMVDSTGTVVGQSVPELIKIDSLLDFALIRPNQPVSPDPQLRDPNLKIEGVRSVQSDDVLRNKRVWMLGARTREVSYGKIISVNSNPTSISDGNHTFPVKDQICIQPDSLGQPFALPGDSAGPLVLEEGNKMIYSQVKHSQRL